eukprot:8576-Heterococcus_DN1.PRE.2
MARINSCLAGSQRFSVAVANRYHCAFQIILGLDFLMSARVSYALATTVIALITVIFCIVRKNGAAPLVTLQPYHRAWQQLIKYDLRYNRQGFDDKMAQHRQAQ